jgi:hypothetical protein
MISQELQVSQQSQQLQEVQSILKQPSVSEELSKKTHTKESFEDELRTFCFSAPKWMQIELQGFFYGLLNLSIQAAEDKTSYQPISIDAILENADSEFTGWPTSWLEHFLEQFQTLYHTYDEYNTFFESADTIFHDSIPTDLNIFTLYANGDILTKEQWTRLYDAVAFIPPNQQMTKKHGNGSKTRHIHGRRAITPIRNRRAITRKKHVKISFIKLS